MGSNMEYDSNKVRITYSSMITPHTIFDYTVSNKELELVKQKNVPNFNQLEYETKRVYAPSKDGINGAIKKAKELKIKFKNSVILQQFSNPANPNIHFKTTAREIWYDTGGNIDALVAGVGTGGTLTGVAEFLKKKDKKIKIFAVEPEDSAVLSGGPLGSHLIQGIGAGFIPKNLNTKLIDEVISINNNTAFEFSKLLAKIEGIPVGISSGAALAAAVEINQEKKMKDKNTIVIIPSFAERYLSTALFSEL